MKTPDDEFVQQYTEAFNEQLQALAQHQNQALAMIFAERLRQDLKPSSQPVSWLQRLQDAYQQVRQQFSSPHPPNVEVVVRPTEEDVVVIDAEYTVFTSVATQTVVPSKGKENKHGLFNPSPKRGADNTGLGPADGEHGAGNPCDPNCPDDRKRHPL